jgi:hypothetical protein
MRWEYVEVYVISRLERMSKEPSAFLVVCMGTTFQGCRLSQFRSSSYYPTYSLPPGFRLWEYNLPLWHVLEETFHLLTCCMQLQASHRTRYIQTVDMSQDMSIIPTRALFKSHALTMNLSSKSIFTWLQSTRDLKVLWCGVLVGGNKVEVSLSWVWNRLGNTTNLHLLIFLPFNMNPKAPNRFEQSKVQVSQQKTRDRSNHFLQIP